MCGGTEHIQIIVDSFTDSKTVRIKCKVANSGGFSGGFGYY
jgi:hypothetical protein